MPRGLLILYISATIVVATVLAWFFNNQDPRVAVPTPKMPTPNALDVYRQAGEKIVGVKTIKRDTPLAEREALLVKNAEALRLLRRGLTMEYRNPPVRSFDDVFPYLAHERSMARILVGAESRVYAGHGNYEAASQSCMDAIELGVQVPRGGPGIHWLVGIAIQAIGRVEMWEYAEHLDADEAKEILARLQQILKKQVPLSDTLREEKWAVIASQQEIFRNPKMHWRVVMKDPNGNPFDKHNQRIYFGSKKAVIRNITKYMDQLTTESQKRYALQRPVPVPNDPYCRTLCPIYPRALLKAAQTDAYNSMLQLVLALRAYKLEHGQYPDALTALTPTYLPRLPQDPFARSGGFRYQRTGNTYLLYSLGPDGKDDHGKPAGTLEKNGKYWSKVTADSTGDLVAGKSR